jgi:folate-dependent phosphoribosylglycinamide formyltransferase PurN
MNIVLLTRDTDSAAILNNTLATVGTVVGVIMEEPVPAWTILKRRAKHLGWVNVTGQALFQTMIVPLLRKQASRRITEIKRSAEMNETSVAESLITRVPTINDTRTIELLQELNPDVVVIQGTRILSSKLLESVKAPFLNVHAGITPLYRGGHGAYWALTEKRLDACGVTVHQVDPGIDTGRILAQTCIRPTTKDSFVTYPWLQFAAGIESLLLILRTPAEAWQEVTPPNGDSRLWHHPTIWKYIWQRFRHGIK